MGVGSQRHAPAALPAGKETRYPMYSWLSGLEGRSGRVRKISSLPGFDPRTGQPVAVAIPTTLARPIRCQEATEKPCLQAVGLQHFNILFTSANV